MKTSSSFYSLYIKPVINFLGSIKLALFLIICLVIMSMIGSIMSESSIEKLKDTYFISLFFDPQTSSFYDFASSFGLIDIYTSPVFIIFLALFTLNILICTFKLFPFAKQGFPFIDENLLDKEIQLDNKDLSYVTDFFFKEGYHVSRSPSNNDLVKAECHKAGRYGVIITHFGIILIMLGAFIGYYKGFSGSMLIFENGLSNQVEKYNGEIVPLNFSVKLNDFNIEFYEGTKTAKAFTSNVSIIENDKEIKNVDINVNQPLKYKDVVFYQASYGQSLNNDMVMDIYIKDNNTENIYEFNYGVVQNIGSYKILVRDFYSDIDFNEKTGKYYNHSDKLANPALYLAVYDSNDNGLMGGWLPLYAEKPTYVPQLNMYFQFKELKNVVYSGFSVKYNPGIYIVYLGGVLLCFGVIFIYLLNYTAVIFTVSNGILKYKVFTQRKFPLVNPVNKFYEYFNISKEN